jgi:hypothetical protein
MWKIDWKDLHVPELMSYLKSNMDPDYDLHRSSLNFLSIQADIGFTEIRVNNFNTEMGFYKKQLVAIKRVKKGHIDLTREIKKDLKLVGGISGQKQVTLSNNKYENNIHKRS